MTIKINNTAIIFILLVYTSMLQAELSIPRNLPKKPNIVFFLVDDLGYGDLKAFNPDSKLVLPTIDRLANEGRIFTDAHSPAAACAPSRYSIITGNNSWRGRDEWGTWRYYGLGSQVLSEQWTLANILKRAGYNTAMIGKYHLGGNISSKTSNNLAFWKDDASTLDFSLPISDSANSIGFDFSFLNLSGVQAPPYSFFKNGSLVGNPADMMIWQPGEYGNSVIEVGGIGISTWDTSRIETILLEEAKQFILDNQRNTPQSPFFLYLPLPAIHSPHTPPTSIAGVSIPNLSGIGNKGDMVQVVDIFVREVLTTLESEGILDETLIIFTSDNGSLKPMYEQLAGHDASGGLRGSKTYIYEGGHRVPLIIKWGTGSSLNSFISPGTSSNALISIQDMFATIAQLVGIDLPINQAMDSVNMTPALFANTSIDQTKRNTLLTISNRDFSMARLPRGEFYYALRESEWKLIVHFKQTDPLNPTPLSLYNLSNDLYETTDLINDPVYANRVTTMLNDFISQRISSRTSPVFVLDIDADGIPDNIDNCKYDTNANQSDIDADQIGDICDAFPYNPLEALDSDGDTIGDNTDNCSQVINTLQRDTDNDGFGNACDADLNGDLIVNSIDLGLFKQRYFSADADADFNGDGIVNAVDLGAFKKMLFKKPGPSGQVSP